MRKSSEERRRKRLNNSTERKSSKLKTRKGVIPRCRVEGWLMSQSHYLKRKNTILNTIFKLSGRKINRNGHIETLCMYIAYIGQSCAFM